MSTGSPDTIGLTFRDATDQLRFQHLKFGCVIAFVMILAGGVMDVTVYPELAWSLLASRFICDAVLLTLFPLIFFSDLGRRHTLLFSTILIGASTIMIAWMVYVADGVASPYYNGLLLMIVTACMLPLYSSRQFLAFVGFVVGLYLLAIFINGTTLTQTDIGLLTNNVFFLVATGAMCVAMNFFDNRRRRRDFELQSQLASALNELKATQVKLIQNEKMNGLGSLAAGLLHEVNNPLNYATLACRTAESLPGTDEDVREILADVKDGLTRIGQVISDLRTFAYPDQAMQFEHFNPAKSAETAVRFTSHLLEDIEIQQDFDPSATPFGSNSLITQVFVNLIANSVKAIHAANAGNGLIKISSMTKPASGSQAAEVQLKFEDNGSGIPEDILSRIFDPFFTTNEVGEGTGLGLSVCHSIIKLHRGEISAAANSQGTVFTINLPCSPTAALKSEDTESDGGESGELASSSTHSINGAQGKSNPNNSIPQRSSLPTGKEP